MKKLFFVALLAVSLIPSTGYAARFYIDGTCATPGNGTSATCSGANAPLGTLRSFTDVARAAGDVAIIRRTATTTAMGVAISVTTDGTLNAPITVQADKDNAFGDFATSSQTFTAQIGSVFMASSASTTDAFPGKWIYVAGDCYENPTSVRPNGCDYHYQIRNASTTGIELYFPYKGTNAGSGKSLRVMPSGTQMSITTNTLAVISLANDDFWNWDGLDMQSSATGGTFVNSSMGTTLKDIVIQTDGTTATPFGTGMDNATWVYKTRTFRNSGNIVSPTGGVWEDFIGDCNAVASTNGFGLTNSGVDLVLKNVTIRGCTNDFLGGVNGSLNVRGINVVREKNLYSTMSANSRARFYFDDDLGTVGKVTAVSNQAAANTNATTTESSSSNLRSGGGPVNLLVYPPSGTGSTGLSDMNFPHSYIQLFEYPIYTDTTSRTYTMYFNSTSTASWSADPTTSATSLASSTPELFIECEYLAETSGVDRVTRRSNTTNDVDFNGSTAWQDISITCQPSQSGILYLRGWYGKKKEAASATNLFFMDLTPVISP